VLPGLNGKEIFNEVVKHFPVTRVLYMSGYTEDRVATRGILDEGIAFIQKPFSTRALAEKVRQVLDSD
jgi:FixJ family two-component response regulator